MKILSLFIEISNTQIIFYAANISEEKMLLAEKIVAPIKINIEEESFDIDEVCNLIKENIYLIERKVKFTFKEIILILEDTKCSQVNISGFKKLNGSQLLRENISYIINSLKSNIDLYEKEKKIIHIFNSKYFLDEKSIDNLPIGLFGDFYSHELSIFMINKEYNNSLERVFNKCNLRIKRIILKNYIDCINIVKKENYQETFLSIQINKDTTKVNFFEKFSLKFNQDFDFGFNIIIKDILKVTNLKSETIKDLLINLSTKNKVESEDLIEDKYFEVMNHNKIKNKLIYEIADARIKELSQYVIFNNINISSFLSLDFPIYLKIKDLPFFNFLKRSFESAFSNNKEFKLFFLDKGTDLEMLQNAHEIVHFGWKKEAMPIVVQKKSMITRFFEAIFK